MEDDPFADLPDAQPGGVALASTFATPSDLADYAQNGSLLTGDNGVGKWGDLTANPEDPIVALPRDLPGVEHNRLVEITGQDGKSTIARIGDVMPKVANLKGDASIDLNPAAAAAIGHPGGVSPVSWKFVDDPFADLPKVKSADASVEADPFADLPTVANPNKEEIRPPTTFEQVRDLATRAFKTTQPSPTGSILGTTEEIPHTPDESQLMSAGKAIINAGNRTMAGLTSADAIPALVLPPVGAGQMITQGAPNLIAKEQAAEATPPGSPQRWEAGADVVTLFGTLAAGGKALGGREPVVGPNVLTDQPFARLLPENLPVVPEPAATAGVLAAAKVEDFIPSEQALGITPFRGVAAADTILTTPDARLTSIDPKVETRWQDARRVQESIFAKTKAAAGAVKAEFTRADPLLDPNTDGVWIDAARRFRTIPRHSQELGANIIRGFTAGFGKNKFEVYQRNIILRDLAQDVSNGHYQGKDLPFGYTPETLSADVEHFGQLAQLNPTVEQAITTRTQFFDTLKKDLVDNNLLPKSVLEQGDYFHRQVVEFLNLKESFTPGVSSGDVRTHTKGFQRARTHSIKDYNTKYLESEYEVISQSLGQLRTVKTLNEFKTADIKEQLQAEALKTNTNWEKLIPADYTIWQPKEGNVFYKALSMPDKIIDDVLNGTKELTKDDLREVLALGSPRQQWVIPKRLAKTLDNINPSQEHGVISKIAQKMTNGWKVWILLNPARSIKYGLNNLSGDTDIALAYSPKIVTNYAAKAAADMRRYVLKRGAITPEISEGIEQGVLSGGFSVAEVPDVSGHQFFHAITGENTHLIERAWQKNKDYHNWRENTLRLASWRYFKDKMASAKNGERFYAASRKAEVDALYDAWRPHSEIAAKLARELIGDYGNISQGGQWIRSHAIPFYSWMEVNAPRYVRLLKNAAAEGEGNVAGRAAGVIGKQAVVKGAAKIAKTTALAAGMYTMVNLWNHTFFPNEEEQLGEQRRQLHLILGHNPDGTLRTLRMQGSLSDALSWVGAEDLPSDIADVVSGKKTPLDQAIESIKAAPAKLITGVTPFIKTPVEALTRRSFFPDPFHPRPIRDSMDAIAQMFSLEKPYRYFTDKPTLPLMNEVAGLVTYSTDPGEAAYHMARGLVASWKIKQGEESAAGTPTRRQNALFYYKKAEQLGDHAKAERWKQRYINLGGLEKGIGQSITASAPLGSISKKREDDFMKTLTPKEQEIVQRAKDWYDKIYNR